MEMDKEKIMQGVRLMLEGIGEDPDRSGLRETPGRVARMFEEIFGGMNVDPIETVKMLDSDRHDEIVVGARGVLKGIDSSEGDGAIVERVQRFTTARAEGALGRVAVAALIAEDVGRHWFSLWSGRCRRRHP